MPDDEHPRNYEQKDASREANLQKRSIVTQVGDVRDRMFGK